MKAGFSIHIYSKTKKDAGQNLTKHQLRQNEAEGKDAAKHSDSKIDPTFSHYNQIYKRPDSLLGEDETLDEFIKRNYQEAIDEREKLGLKKIRETKSTGVFGTFTLQLSDSALEKLGWDKSKTPDEQQNLIPLITRVYDAMYGTMNRHPDDFGQVVAANLHFDESNNPHVDGTLLCMDKTHPDRTIRSIKVGKEQPRVAKRDSKGNIMRKPLTDKQRAQGRKQGMIIYEKNDGTNDARNHMSQLQDIMLESFTKESIKKYGLGRYPDDAKHWKHAKDREEAAEQKETEVAQREQAVIQQEQALEQQAAALALKTKEVEEREAEVERHEEALKANMIADYVNMFPDAHVSDPDGNDATLTLVDENGTRVANPKAIAGLQLESIDWIVRQRQFFNEDQQDANIKAVNEALATGANKLLKDYSKVIDSHNLTVESRQVLAKGGYDANRQLRPKPNKENQFE